MPTEEKIISVHAHGYSSYVITENGKLWVWGSNSWQQLGLDRNKTPFMKLPCEGPSFFSAVVDLAPGVSHVLALTRDGSVWGWGNNADGRLGIPLSDSKFELFMPFQLPFQDVARVYAGSFNSLVLTKKGALYIWGWNNYGLLGRENTNNESTHVPHLVVPSGVHEVACGLAHVIVLLKDGSLWGWGNNRNHQLGFFDCAEQHVPRKIGIPDLDGKISGLICGEKFSAVVTNYGKLHVLGDLIPDEDPPRVEKKLFVPQTYWDMKWKDLFLWLFLGKEDTGSIFSFFPVEVLFHFFSIL